MQLDDNLKQLMKELGAAINDALSESEEISEAIDVLVTETRTTDPVRLYMREMGKVELVTS